MAERMARIITNPGGKSIAGMNCHHGLSSRMGQPSRIRTTSAAEKSGCSASQKRPMFM
jgi:hypothetical protein